MPRGARLGQHPARAWRASVDTVCATFTSLPVYDHLSFNDPTRPAPHRSPLRSRRRSRRRKRETEPRRGTSYYDVRAARDGRCGLPSAEARPPARASWRQGDPRDPLVYTYELGGRVPRSSYETVPRYAARYASRVPRRRRRRAPRPATTATSIYIYINEFAETAETSDIRLVPPISATTL